MEKRIGLTMTKEEANALVDEVSRLGVDEYPRLCSLVLTIWVLMLEPEVRESVWREMVGEMEGRDNGE